MIGNVPGNQGIRTEGQILQQVAKKKKTKKKGRSDRRAREQAAQ